MWRCIRGHPSLKPAGAKGCSPLYGLLRLSDIGINVVTDIGLDEKVANVYALSQENLGM
jgi:hypothetical protein